MKSIKYVLLLIIIPSLLTGLEYVPKQLIFKTLAPQEIARGKIGLEKFDSFLTEKEVKNIKPILKKNDNKYFIANLNKDFDWENIKSLKFVGIEYFQPNYLNSFYIAPNDPEYYNQLTEFENCNIPQAWNYTTGNPNIVIGVIDSGIYFDHPDLQTNIYINENEIPDDGIDNDNNGYIDDWRGWDFVDAPELYNIGVGDYLEQDNDPTDEISHGTHVSGIIAADTNNNAGIAGITWNNKIMVIRAGFKTVDGFGYLQDDDAASGVIYAADMGADVINLSWGDINYSPIIADACNYAYQKGTIIIASAGNEGSSSEHLVTYPARLTCTIAVGSIDNDLTLSSFSSYGPQLDIVAPGSQILSTYKPDSENLYYQLSGTSMSGPFVAASLGLLLSVEPNLNFEEARNRLLTSCTDLGDAGFDNTYGYGLLNTYELLTNNISSIVEITSPLDNSGYNDSFDIIGTVTAQNLWRYSVKYTSVPMPTSEDWQDVGENSYYYEPVEDGILAHFEINDYLNSGTYQIKVEAVTHSNQHYSSCITVHIDQSPPEFRGEYAAIMKRYKSEIPEYYLQAVFNEKVHVELNIPPSNNYELVTNVADSVQVCQIPNNFCGGSINIKATNICGLETYVNDAYSFTPDYEPIDVNSFNQTNLSYPLTSMRRTYDFNNNGKNEIIAFNLENEENHPLISIEINDNNELEEVHDFGFNIWPHDLGNTNEEGMEIMGINSAIDSLVIYETTSENYPNEVIYQTDNAYGGNFIDHNGDGIEDIAIVKNIIDEDGYIHRIVELLERDESEFNITGRIFNCSSTSGVQTFVNKVACGNLDGDPFQDILTADSDGDVMIFEKFSNECELVWLKRLPVSNPYFLLVEDFTGDGNDDFCAGGYTTDFANPNKSFSFFEFFSNNGNNNEYISTGYISFSEVEDHNSIASADLDGDEDQEIILSVSPNIYIIDYVNGEYIPIWKGESSQNAINVIAACDSFIVTNVDDFGEFKSALIKVGEEFSGPPTPQYFSATPIDSISVKLNWNSGDFDEVNIYKKKGDDTEFVGTSDSLLFVDRELITADTIFYRITAMNYSCDPEESRPTIWKSAIPLPAPNIEYLKMISQYDLKIKFDQPVASNAFNISNYFLDPNMSYPLSVNIVEENTAVILKFSTQFENIDNYTIYFSNITGTSGVPISNSSVSFDYQEDTEPPEIIDTYVSNLHTVVLKFSEALNNIQATDINNFNLVLPEIDQLNGIESIQYFNSDSISIEIKLQENMKYTSQSYFLWIENIEDIVGNLISNSGNKCYFSLTNMNLNNLVVYPNPLDLSKSTMRKVNFANIPLGVVGEICLYNLAGELVFNSKFGPYYDSKFNFFWNCKNNAGKQVSSGIYFYIIKVENKVKKGKFVIIN